MDKLPYAPDHGWKNKMQEAITMLDRLEARTTPKSPYPDYNIMACPHCGSGEYLHNHDGNQMPFCGQCGQAIDWEEI